MVFLLYIFWVHVSSKKIILFKDVGHEKDDDYDDMISGNGGKMDIDFIHCGPGSGPELSAHHVMSSLNFLRRDILCEL